MFLTGQLFPMPWDEPEDAEPRLKKDSSYYDSSGTVLNSWNNPNKTCKKIYKFYHEKEKVFKDTTYKDDEILKMDEDEKQELRKTVLQRMRYQSLERINNRKLEREVLQYKSKQALVNDETSNEMEAIAHNDPVLFEELSLRRSNSFKDPSRPITATITNWNQDPSNHLSKLPGLKFCKWIADKAKVSDVVDQMETMWKQENRRKIRQKFIEQHEKNIERERKAGIYKDYQTMAEQSKHPNATRNRPLTTANLIRNRRLIRNSTQVNPSGLTTYQNDRRNIVTANSEQPQDMRQEVFSQRDDERIISKRSEVLNEYNSQRVPTENDDTKTIDRRNIEEVNEISSTDEQRNIDDQQDEMEEAHLGENKIISDPRYTQQEQMNDPQMDYYDHQMPRDIGLVQNRQNEFRISYSRPKFPVRNMTTERLAQPKRPFKVNNPFLYSDCAGLIDPKHIDQVKNSTITTPYLSSQTDNSRMWTPNDGTFAGASQSLRGRKKFSEHVNEIFPIPEFNTYLSKPTKKKDRRKLTKATSALRHLRSGTTTSHQLGSANMQNEEQFKSTMSSLGTRSVQRARTHQSQRHNLKSKQLEEERREIQEIQESMKALDEFDMRHERINKTQQMM